MKQTPISAHAVQLTRMGLFNMYLVREEDGLTLIDTGTSGGGQQIRAAAKAFGGQSGVQIRRILLTHAHGDHTGSVDELVKGLIADGVVPELIASERSVPILQKPADLSLRLGEPQKPIKGSTPGISVPVRRTVGEGDQVGSLRVIETPGHIPGHLSFLDERDGTLYAGDAVICVGKEAVSGFAPWYFPLPNLATWDKALALQSARRLFGLSFEMLASGHGTVRGGGPAALKRAIQQAEQSFSA